MAHDNPSGAKALLEKFQAGKCTPEELAILEQWYATLDEDNPIQLSAQQTLQYRQAFLYTFRNRLRQQTPPPYVIRRWAHPIRWVAAACLLLLAGIGYKWLLNKSAQPTTASNVHLVANTTAHVKKIVLADSSVVWLNAHASLSWTDDEAQQRRVALNGEGYFEVRTNAQHPFIIDTRDLQISVLGTAFNVEAYATEKMTRVALVNGSVQLRTVADSSSHLLLKPGQMATLAANEPLTVTATDAAAMAGWTNGGFVVNNISVKDAIARLCERNACSLQWENTKSIHKLISVSFMHETFEQSLNNICYLSNKQYKIQGNHVTIY